MKLTTRLNCLFGFGDVSLSEAYELRTGSYPILPASMIVRSPDMKSHIDDLKLRIQTQYEQLAIDIVNTAAEYLHLLPGSRAHHHRHAGGLLMHSIETAIFAIQQQQHRSIYPRFEDYRLDRTQCLDRSQLCLLILGLTHDFNKIGYGIQLLRAPGRPIDPSSPVFYRPLLGATRQPTLMEWAGDEGGFWPQRFWYNISYDERLREPPKRAWKRGIEILLHKHPNVKEYLAELAPYFFDFESRFFRENVHPIISEADHQSVENYLNQFPPDSGSITLTIELILDWAGEQGFLKDVQWSNARAFLTMAKMRKIIDSIPDEEPYLWVCHDSKASDMRMKPSFLWKQIQGVGLAHSAVAIDSKYPELSELDGQRGIFLAPRLSQQVAFWQRRKHENGLYHMVVGADPLTDETPYQIESVSPDEEVFPPDYLLPPKCNEHVRLLADFVDEYTLDPNSDLYDIDNKCLVFTKEFFLNAVEATGANPYVVDDLHRDLVSSRWLLIKHGRIVEGICCTPEYTRLLLGANDLVVDDHQLRRAASK